MFVFVKYFHYPENRKQKIVKVIVQENTNEKKIMENWINWWIKIDYRNLKCNWLILIKEN